MVPKEGEKLDLSAGKVEPVPAVVGQVPKEGADGSAVTAAAQVDLSAKPADAVIANPVAPDAGQVHTDFVESMGKVDEPTAKADIDALTGKSPEAYTIEDIRYNARLLKKKSEGEEKPEDQVVSLKEETARRMKAYTTDAGDGWFQLDYAKMGADKNGLTHELYVGLGDVLLDLDIQEIVVEKKDGQTVKAHRGVASSGKNSGRVCFLDENNEYVFTNTGDKFRILSKDKMEAAAYATKLTEETGKREAGRATFESSVVNLAMAEKEVTMKDGIDLKETYTDASGKEVTVAITNDVINGAAAECSGSSGIEKAAETKENLMKILNYISYKVGVPASAMLAVLYHECGIRFPANVGDGGLAIGMGQFHPESWATQKKDPKFHELVSQVIKENPGEAGRNRNIFVDLVGVATCLKYGAELFGFDVSHSTPPAYLTEEKVTAPDGIVMTRIAWMRMYYHVPSYARDYAKTIKGKSIDVLKPRYKERFYAKSKPWLEKNMHRYMKLSGNTAIARRKMDAMAGRMAA